jgi:hypothetical protein
MQRRLLESLKNLGLNYQDVPRDGNCLYHAVCIYVGEDQQTLRNNIYLRLEQNPSQYEHIFQANNMTLASYLVGLKTDAWADHLEIVELMNLLNRPIVVIGPDGTIRNRGDVGRAGEPIFVFYNGHSHYDGFTVNHTKMPREILNSLLNANMFVPPVVSNNQSSSALINRVTRIPRKAPHIIANLRLMQKVTQKVSPVVIKAAAAPRDTSVVAVKRKLNTATEGTVSVAKRLKVKNELSIAERLKKFNIDELRYNKELLIFHKLGYQTEQANKVILRKFSFNSVDVLLGHHAELIKRFTRNQIVDMAANHSGSKNIEAVLTAFNALIRLKFSTEQIVRMVADGGGARNIEAVLKAFNELIGLKFSTEQIVRIAANGGGSKNIEAVQDAFNELRKLQFTAAQIVRIAAHHGGSKNIEAVQKAFNELSKLQFTAAQIVSMVAHNGGSKNIEAVRSAFDELSKLQFTAGQIVKMVANTGGSKNISAVVKNFHAIYKLNLSPQAISNLVVDAAGRNEFLRKCASSKEVTNFVQDLQAAQGHEAALTNRLNEQSTRNQSHTHSLFSRKSPVMKSDRDPGDTDRSDHGHQLGRL